MPLEIEDFFTEAENAVLVRTLLESKEPSHSCAECGITTSYPGAYCEVCSESLTADGVFAFQE